MYTPGQGYDMGTGQAMPNQWAQQGQPQAVGVEGEDEGDAAHRPPNAFILYSQAMRSAVRQENPSLSNTECSRLLGKMWKEVSSDQKMQYKHRAAAAQEEFKRQHPNYTYRKARRKRALNELLTKNVQAFPGAFPTDSAMMGMMGNQNMYHHMMQPMFAQNPNMQPGQGGMMHAQGMGFAGMPGQMGMPQGQMGMQMQMPGYGSGMEQNMYLGPK